jgi:type IV pilus assembly protein PilC
MPRFRFVAMDSKGAETEGVLDAENQAQAVTAIRGKGLFPTRITEQTSGPGAARKPAGRAAQPKTSAATGASRQIKMPSFMTGKVKPKQLMTFTRQLSTLNEAGLPLMKGLRILLKQEKDQTLRDAVNGMSESVEGGSTFSESLAQFPKIFDKLYINMVKAGEAGGCLDTVLTRLAEFMEKTEKIKNKVKSAMVYPVVVMVVAVAILAFLLTNVIPKFQEIFTDLLEGKPLPGITLFVLNASAIVRTKGLYIVAGIAILVIVINVWKKTATGAYTMDRIKLRMPLFGDLFLKTAVARFTRTLGTLLSSGVPVLQALNIIRETAGNEVIARAIQSIHDSVKEGDSMAMPMEAARIFPPMVVSMVDVGEETGALPEMLIRVADNYDDEVDNAVEGLTSVIEPIMIVFLALIIGTIVIAMFVPLISIISNMAQ